MANVRVCDRCGVQIAIDPTEVVTFGACKCTVMNNNGMTWSNTYDLCLKCADKLDDFLKRKE